MNKQTKPSQPRLIASNKKAKHDYFIEDRYEAGLMLQGWEVKSIRAGRVNLQESYVIVKRGEAWVIGVHISPLPTADQHNECDPLRTRKLLLHRREINKLIGAKERQGYTIVILDLHWHKNRVKAQIAIGKGKKLHDKRASIKEKDWAREKARSFKQLKR